MNAVKKVKRYWRMTVWYIKYDFREIVWPSCLPDPPHLVEALKHKKRFRDLTFKDHVQIWKKGIGMYMDSWKEKNEEEEVKAENGDKKQEQEQMSIMDELASAARMGGDRFQPALQRIYMTRLSTYRDAMRGFVAGYQEGLEQAIESSKKEAEQRAKIIAERIMREQQAKAAADKEKTA